jgi:transposase
MLTQEENVDVHALRRRGWSIAAIARHLGRDPKTIRAYLSGERAPGARRPAGPDAFAPFEEYARARLGEDPHLWASALHDELVELGYARSYQVLTRELRRRALRPRCEACAGTRGRVTVEIAHPPGEELQFDWLELGGAAWAAGGRADLLAGTLAHSGKVRAFFAEATDQAHLVHAVDGVLRRLGGTARVWRFDRMATVCHPGSGRLHASFAAVARHYGVQVAICPAYRPNRKGAVESRNHFIAQRFWRTTSATTMADAQQALDRFSERVGDARRRGGATVGQIAAGERLLGLPVDPYPATLECVRTVDAYARVSYQGNRYSLPPGLVGHQVTLRRRLGERQIEIVSAAGVLLARHQLLPTGSGGLAEHPVHRQTAEQLVLAATTARRGPACPRRPNRPPGELAQAAARAIRGEQPGGAVVIDLADWARAAEGARP